MDILRAWIKKEGREGRKRLVAALKVKFPGTTSTHITSYASGYRIPDKDRASVIAEVTGLPLEKLTYRYYNRPVGKKGRPSNDRLIRTWIEKQNGQGRAVLMAALKDRFPGIHAMSLNNYLTPPGKKGHRIPDKDRAEVIAEVLGVPLGWLVYRGLHTPTEAP
jgi:hypothetical protein